MATSTLRALILAALVVVGVVGLTKLFPQNESLGITGAGGPTSTVSNSPSSTPTGTPTPTPSRKAKVKGVVVLVLNGTTRRGLAAEVSRTLANAGYKMKVPGNAKSIRRTIVYYRADSLPEAQLIVQKYFPDALLRRAPASVPDDVRVEIVLGADFVTSSPSP
ncbi:MAG TPA: LytR C-terminal domain-containing protein [Actinomycetota bacterium]|nr:LytR C-terminal domain-containing protein [Actinomycetota bacterium]